MEQGDQKEASVQERKRPLFMEIFESVAIAVLLAVVIRLFLIAPFSIPSGSMEPALKVNDKILASKLNYYVKDPKRGDIVVFKYPKDTKRYFVKRLIGVGGETVSIRNSLLYINGQPLAEDYLPPGLRFADFGPVEVPSGSYFMLGDNRNNSDDSRVWGFLPSNLIFGKAVFIYWPPHRLGAAH